MKKEKETYSDDQSYKLHENGLMYKEIEFQGMDEPLKLFISIKPQRLPGETQTEYKLRRMMEKRGNMQKKHNPQYVQDPRLGTYVNKNKKDKFKKKK